ncbi:MAG: family 43 glycosylhydrolase [Lachnospiraceae bacterium]|nr:family 43 glycosylhydrolase [Lachnospiraceae bacterium]
MPYIENPIARGFYPDPSICRVGEYYYRIHSTFAYAPGIPVFRSSDLQDWEQIGHVLTRDSQLDLLRSEVSGGIFAPTIRWNKGIFYVIVTNVDAGGNFYVTAEDPAGPWSDPIFLKDAPGIDPSLFFEGDHCYYIGQRQKEDARFFGDCEIWIRELDLQKGCLTGETAAVWDGAMKNACWAEGPHLYKKDDYYYLMIAESGTEYNHSISIARSRSLYGPYESCPRNPIFTHRNLGRQYPVQCAGHGDLFDTPEGDWYITMLAVRMEKGAGPLGRETFLADVIWEEDWPVINAGEGRLRKWQWVKSGAKEASNDGKPDSGIEALAADGKWESGRSQEKEWAQQHDFKEHRQILWQHPLPHRLLGLRRFWLAEQSASGQERASGQESSSGQESASGLESASGQESTFGQECTFGLESTSGQESASGWESIPGQECTSAQKITSARNTSNPLTLADGKLRISLSCGSPDQLCIPAFAGIRMESMKFELYTKMRMEDWKDGGEAGLIWFYDGRNYLSLTCKMESGRHLVCVTEMKNGIRKSLFERTLDTEENQGGSECREFCPVKIEADRGHARFWRGGELLAEHGETGFLSSQAAGGFTGCILGIYGSGNEADPCGTAIFDTLNTVFWE